MRYLVEYSSNNSGGSWWLKDEDWFALEKAGWVVDWCKNNKSEFCKPDKNGRWLGALATNAFLVIDANSEVTAEKLAIVMFEDATGQCAEDRGCPCCGEPHSFWARGLDLITEEHYSAYVAKKIKERLK